MSETKAPVEKLPLAARKNVRDEWANKKPELEGKLLTLLGVPWTFDINPLAIYPYAEVGSYGNHSLGECIFKYAESFMDSLKAFLEKHGDEGKSELNSVCAAHTITMVASSTVSYCGSSITNGTFNLLFNPGQLASNISQVADNLAEAISSAPQPENAPSLSYAARHSIKTQYDPKIGDILEKCRKELQNPEFKLEAEFEKIGEMLKGGGSSVSRDDWEQSIGTLAYNYFEGFWQVLEREGFGKDELLREGFEEGCEKGVARLRVVGKLKGGSGYNELVLEDGELVLQTTPANWGVNISYTTENLVALL